MSDENSELDELDDYSSINVEFESFEALSTVSSAPSQILELGHDREDGSKAFHLVHQLYGREIGLRSRKSQILAPFKSFPLFQIFPQRVLQGQVFMGMTRCGRFLMTYSTHLLHNDDEWYESAHQYELHWWRFEPDAVAKEIGSVLLFGNAKLTDPLEIYICQWPKYDDKVLVYGLEKESGIDGGSASSNQRAFVTVTAIPSANHCAQCVSVKESFLLGDYGSKSKFAVKCLRHSFAVHTSFDIAVPFPEFQPRVHLKCEDYVVFNTNNGLHSLRISWDSGQNLQELQVDAEEEVALSVQVPPSPSSPFPASSQLQEQIIRDFADDGLAIPRKIEDPGLSCLSPPLPTRVKIFTDPEDQTQNETNHEFLTPKVFLKVKKCCGRKLGFFSRSKPTTKFLESHSRKSSPYEFVDDSQSEVEKLSQFRRKRLAEKTYEFQECDSENIVPFSLARQGPGRYLSQLQVLRPLNRNTLPRSRFPRLFERIYENKSTGSSSYPRVRVLDNDILVYDISGRYGDLAAEDEENLQTSLRRLGHCFRGSASRFTRRYHEVDEERVSIATDVEDDDATTTAGYHTLLNMDVHGTRYDPLHAAPKGAPPTLGVRIEQQSVDIEAICQSVATSLCQVANKTFTFCNDYDVEVIDVCPQSGDVLVLLMMRIQACEGKKEEGSIVEQYEASVTLLWNLIQGDYRITMVVPPQKANWAWNEKSNWNPAREAARKFRASLPADVTWTSPSVRLCSNISYLRGVSLAAIQDFDNRVQFVL